MSSTTRRPCARLRNCILYHLSLTGEVSAPGWAMRVDKDRLADAVDAAMRAGPPRRTSLRRGLAAAAVLTVCEGGLAVRAADAGTDIPAIGMWASPIVADGSMLLRVLARLADDRVDLGYGEGRLTLNDRSLRAREI